MSNRPSVPILKTHKLFLGGGFPRSESGRCVDVRDSRGRLLAHVARASRKDLREAVRSARKSQAGWAGRTAYNRGQILYRAAEMLQGRGEEFTELVAATVKGGRRRAQKELEAACDRLVAYAGWADKFAQVLGCNNPVAGPFYNFSVPEPTGVVGLLVADEPPLLSLVDGIAAPLCAGNAVVALASESHPLAAAVLGEVFATSDLPDGVVSVLTGIRSELLPHFAAHRDINAIRATGISSQEACQLREGTADNMKRVVIERVDDWYSTSERHHPWLIEPFLETKTVWHPSST